MTLDQLIHYLRLRDYHLCGVNDEKQQAAFTWSVDSNVVVVVGWSDERKCFIWRVANRFLSHCNSFLRFKDLPLEQDIYIDRMFDALNAQIDHFYKWVFPAHIHAEDASL